MLNLEQAKKAKKADAKPAAVTKAKTPTREEGRTASGLPREARGGGPGANKRYNGCCKSSSC
jgi:hypothetical protein